MEKLTKSCVAVLLAVFIASPASAFCYADYKAKRDNPLRLHYGVIELPDAACDDPDRTKAVVAKRLQRFNWQLLNVVSVFDESGLEQRKESAGQFFLRF